MRGQLLCHAGSTAPVMEVQHAIGLQDSSRLVSGPVADIESLSNSLKANGTKVKLLQTPYAFHSKQMDDLSTEYGNISKAINFNKPRMAVASTVLADIVKEQGIFNAQHLCRQTREPVNFQAALEVLHKVDGIGEAAFWIEVGPALACLPAYDSISSSL